MGLQFTATIQINGVNPYILVTAEQAANLQSGWRRPMPVRVQINGQPLEPWRINMMPKGGGDFYLYLHEIVRRASGTKVGDRVEVWVDFDEQYISGPQDPIPNGLARGIKTEVSVRQNWAALSPSRQKEVLRYLARLQSEEALRRNLAQTLFVLRGNDGHYMGRDWHDGK